MSETMRIFGQIKDAFRRARSIRVHLVALVLVALCPALAFGIYAVRVVGDVEQATYDQRLRQTVDDLTNDIDRSIDSMLITLRILATAPSLERDDLGAFHTHATAALAGSSFGVVLFDTSGQQVMNTQVPFGSPLPKTADTETPGRVLQTGRPHVSNLFTGAIVKRPILNVDMPVLRNGETRYIIAISFDPSFVLQILRGQNLSAGWVTGVSDSNGRVIARSVAHEQFVGTILPDELFKRRGQKTMFEARNLDGVPVMRAVSSTKIADWMVAATVPVAVAHAESRSSQWALAAIGLSALMLSLLAASGLTKVLAHAVLDLAAMARRTGSGERIGRQPTGVSEAAEVQTALVQANEARLTVEDQLREVAERLAISVRLAGVASSTITYEPTGSPVVHLTQELGQMLGLGDGPASIPFREAVAAIHVEDRQSVTSAYELANSATGNGQFDIEHRVVKPNGTVAWLSVRSSTIFDGEGAERHPRLTFIAVRDVSTRRRRVDELRASEQRYRAALLVGRIASWETDFVSRSRLWSPEGMSLFGLSMPDMVGTVGGPDDEYRKALHPDDRHLVERFHALAESRDEFAAEYRILLPDGRVSWVSGRGHVMERDEAGHPLRLLSVVADITERKQAEEAIRASEARFRLLAEAVPNITWTATAAGALDWHSPRWTEYTGLVVGSPVEPNWPSTIHDDDDDRTRAAWRAALDTGGIYEIEHRLRGKDGIYRWFLSRAVPIKGDCGEVIKWVGSATNIDANKRIATTLARANAAADAAYDGLIGLTLDGRVDSWNRGAMRLFGFEPSDVIGDSSTQLVPAGDEAAHAAMLETVRDGKQVGPVDVKRRHKDGRLVDVAISMTPVVDAAGHIVAIAKVAHDISGRLEADRRQMLLNRELLHRVKNSFAILQSIMRATLRSSPDPKKFAEAFSGRLQSMAKAQDLVTERHWSDADVGDLVRQQLAAHGLVEGGPIDVAGAEVLVPSDLIVPLGLILNELATNAAKYGALSAANGRVMLSWSQAIADGARSVGIVWHESGGPPVSEPSGRGFGTTLIESSIPNATVTREFLPGGLICTIEITLPVTS